MILLIRISFSENLLSSCFVLIWPASLNQTWIKHNMIIGSITTTEVNAEPNEIMPRYKSTCKWIKQRKYEIWRAFIHGGGRCQICQNAEENKIGPTGQIDAYDGWLGICITQETKIMADREGRYHGERHRGRLCVAWQECKASSLDHGSELAL